MTDSSGASVLAFQVGADPLTDRVDQSFQRLGAGGRQSAKHRWFAVAEIHPVQKQHMGRPAWTW